MDKVVNKKVFANIKPWAQFCYSLELEKPK